MLNDKLTQEFSDQSLFDAAKDYALEFLDSSPEAVVFPTEDSIQKLQIFDEPMPTVGTHAQEVLELLHTYGSPKWWHHSCSTRIKMASGRLGSKCSDGNHVSDLREIRKSRGRMVARIIWTR